MKNEALEKENRDLLGRVRDLEDLQNVQLERVKRIAKREAVSQVSAQLKRDNQLKFQRLEEELGKYKSQVSSIGTPTTGRVNTNSTTSLALLFDDINTNSSRRSQWY